MEKTWNMKNGKMEKWKNAKMEKWKKKKTLSKNLIQEGIRGTFDHK